MKHYIAFFKDGSYGGHSSGTDVPPPLQGREFVEVPDLHPIYDKKTPYLVNGVVKYKDAVDPTHVSTEVKWLRVKQERDNLLKDSDWTVIKAMEGDFPMSEAWKAYRQKLRDITLQPDPFSITWPVKPS